MTYDPLDTGPNDSDADKALSIEALDNRYDHLVDESDSDLDTLFNSDLAGGETVVIGPGTHTYKNIEPSVDDVELHVLGEYLLASDADGTSPTKDTQFVLREVSGWDIYWHGAGAFDGNKSSVSDPGNAEDSINCLSIANCDDIRLYGAHLRDNHANGLYVTAGSTRVRVYDPYIHDCGSNILFYKSWKDLTDAGPSRCLISGGVSFNAAGGNGAYGIYLSGGTQRVKTVGLDLFGNADNQIRIDGVDGSERNIFDDLTVDATASNGIGAWITNGPQYTKILNSNFKAAQADNGNRLIYLTSGDAKYSVFKNLDLIDSDGNAIENNGSDHCKFIDLNAIGASTYGLKLNAGKHCIVRGGNYVDNGQGAGGASGIVVRDDYTRVLEATLTDTGGGNQNNGISTAGSPTGLWISDVESFNHPSNDFNVPDTTPIDGVAVGTYAGDGNATQSINSGYRPIVVYVEESGGTLYETRDDGFSLINGSDPPGGSDDLAITDTGFDVGNGTGDEDPNTDGETYTFRAEYRSRGAA